ncbi:MAG: aminotransferase class V-fold PLP-dependent enzyme, partial [Calditrichaeota bacterium]|nr:aminotransferase class V-fold PLP-dependent enzyme [Calditrichota bacterium]
VEGFEAINTGAFLDVDYNIATRTGLHCAPLVHEQMHTAEIGGTVRFSFGPFNTEEHVDAAIHAVGEIVMMSKGWTKSINY